MLIEFVSAEGAGRQFVNSDDVRRGYESESGAMTLVFIEQRPGQPFATRTVVLDETYDAFATRFASAEPASGISRVAAQPQVTTTEETSPIGG